MRKITILKSVLMGSVALSALSLSPSVYAQDDEETEDGLEEIYVTARKKRELLAEVPMNITNVGSEEIGKRNLLDREEIYRTIAGAANPRGQLILRGLSGSNSSAPGTTTTFTDGVPLNFSNLFDVERVEVLRGPQGTLWGSNALGGTVQVITKKPNLSEMEVLGSIVFSDEENRPGVGTVASAAVNIPLIEDKLALRVTGSTSNENKKILNTATGTIGVSQNNFLRAQLLWAPTDSTRINLMYVNEYDNDTGFTDTDVNAPSYHYEAVLTANDDAPYGYDVSFDFPSCNGVESRSQCLGGLIDGHPRRFTRYQSVDSYDKDMLDVFALNIEVDDIFAGADFTYTGSYQKIGDYGRQGWWSRADANDMFDTWIIDDTQDRRWTHEARLQSNVEDSAFDWTVGVFYDEYKTLPTDSAQWQYHASDNASRAIAAYLWGTYWGLADPSALGAAMYGDDTKNYNYAIERWISKEFAAFGEASYTADLGDAGKLEITGGIRFYDLQDDLHDKTSGVWVDPYDQTVLETITKDGENGTRKKVSVNYMPNDDLGIFAIYSEGYRPGGNNGPTAPADCAADENIGSYTDRYESDKINNYEVGVKGLAFDRKLQFSAAAYHIDWTGVQARVYMPSCGFSYTANAASARSRGMELETTFLIADGLKLLLNASYTDSKITADVPSLGAEDGDDMTMVPDYNFYAALDKEFELYGQDASVRLEFLGYGEYKSHFNVKDSDIAPAYQLLNLSASYSLSENASLSFYLNNVLDSDIILYKRSRSRGDWSGNALWVEYGEERNIAVRLDFKF